jgi:hypothetical protein
MKTVTVDEEDLEFLNERLKRLKQYRDMATDMIIREWKNQGCPEPDYKKCFDDPKIWKDGEVEWDMFDDFLIATNWVRHGENVPSDARRYYAHYSEWNGAISELTKITETLDKVSEEG